MDLRGRVPNIKALQRSLKLGSYDKLYKALAGTGGISVALAKRIETATGGLIRWTEFFEEDASAHQPPPSVAA